GCDATQDCFLVAERWIGAFRSEVWVLMQYLEGVTLERMQDFAPHRTALEETARELLRHDLTMDDVAPGNFIVADDRIRAIDISCRPFSRLHKVSMIWKLNHAYGLGLSVTNRLDRILYALSAIRRRNSSKQQFP
ncbi:MAG: hypothetical protein LBS30_03140, partial [Planctomycetota bacterium]|nr:hypothetical protein [Planctomycetota bacterium]